MCSQRRRRQLETVAPRPNPAVTWQSYSFYLWRFGLTAAALGKASRNSAVCVPNFPSRRQRNFFKVWSSSHASLPPPVHLAPDEDADSPEIAMAMTAYFPLPASRQAATGRGRRLAMRRITLVAAICVVAGTTMIIAGWDFGAPEPKAATAIAEVAAAATPISPF